jgi:hypothetical protein
MPQPLLSPLAPTSMQRTTNGTPTYPHGFTESLCFCGSTYHTHKFVCTGRQSAEDYAKENGKAVEYAEAVRKVQRVWRFTLGLGHEQSGRDRMTWIDFLLRLLGSAAVRGWGSEPA